MNFLKSLFLLIALAIAINSNAQKTLLDSIIHIAEKESIFTKNVDWNKLIPKLYESIDTTKSDSVEAIIPAVEKLYTALGDKHGLLMYNDKVYRGEFKQDNKKVDSNLYKDAYNMNYIFRTKNFDENYAYLSVPSIQIDKSVMNDKKKSFAQMSQYAQILKDSLCKLSNGKLKGLIIDMRLCMGGTYAIIIDGLASIIGDGNVFDFINEDDKKTKIKLNDGKFYENNEIESETDSECSFENVKVVLLLSPITASAGEQTAIAFRGRKNTKFFGENSAGYVIMTNAKIFNRENLIVTFSEKYIQDKQRHLYKDFITPDVEIIGGDNFQNLEKDNKVIAALKWLKEK